MWVTPTSGVIGPVTYISSELLFQMVYKSWKLQNKNLKSDSAK
jgi:hypothetical protein